MQPKVVDLFAGCGGMSLGFELAGFSVACAVERDAGAAATYGRNHPGVRLLQEDVRNVDAAMLAPEGGADGVIGGPPCQSFSVSGSRNPHDPRGALFRDYMRIVAGLRPKFFVMENVPGMLTAKTAGGVPVRKAVAMEAEKAGYGISILALNAADYGVPQTRRRVFFVGLRRDLGLAPMPEPARTAERPVTIREALSDLPPLRSGEGGGAMDYALPPQNAFQRWCRRNSDAVRNHEAMRHTARVVERFRHTAWGQSAADLPDEYRQRMRGDPSKPSRTDYSQNSLRPHPDAPSPTIPAGFQSCFVHPLQDRNYTAREGARLQSFPDDYVFLGRRTAMSWDRELSQYHQIGNAVPPLLAMALGRAVAAHLGGR